MKPLFFTYGEGLKGVKGWKYTHAPVGAHAYAHIGKSWAQTLHTLHRKQIRLWRAFQTLHNPSQPFTTLHARKV
jgi:hypothetical protein